MRRLSFEDPSSYSNPEEFCITKIHLDLDVDFNAQKLVGSIQLNATKLKDVAENLILDVKCLIIKSVLNSETRQPLPYIVSTPIPVFGSALKISFTNVATLSKVSVEISYETTEGCSALQWMLPEQTAGKRHPYLFSQCQAIHARSLLPCQDTPAIKAPYTAKLRVSRDLKALMSAVCEKSELDPDDASKIFFHFTQNIPIPSYLIALVVGDLESRKIGPISMVWSEREVVDEAAKEFAEIGKLIEIAESLVGEYVWGRYDILVLPPSFPYGGMENPCLTFATPTLLTGDLSPICLIAHELAHSWTGNLVTNRNWQHFWLNEGHTVFLERKIIGRLKGEETRQFMASNGLIELQKQILDMFKDINHPYTRLVIELNGVDPDDAFSMVPYEKGSCLLMYLEQLLGGPSVFEPFLKAYIDNFKYKSITTDDWKEFLYKFFQSKKDILDLVDWKKWLHEPGMPPNFPCYDRTLETACIGLFKKWLTCPEKPTVASGKDFKLEDIENFSSFQVIAFLTKILEKNCLNKEQAKFLTEVYQLDKVTNYEIRFRWLRLSLQTKLPDYIGNAIDFVNSQGRMKFVRPVYRDMFEWEVSRERAIENFRSTRHNLNPITANMVEKDLSQSVQRHISNLQDCVTKF